MTAALDLSPLLDRLAGPAGMRLSLALLHFLWQGVLIAAAAAVLMRLVGRRSADRRYAIGVAGLMLMAAAPVATFCLVTPPPPTPRSVLEDLPPSDDLLLEIERLDTLLAAAESRLGDGTEPDLPVADPPLTWSQRLRLWQPYALLLWLAGTGLFTLRLGIGVRASWAFGRGRRPLPETWLATAARVADRLGLKRARVFVSDRVAEAVAVGLWRPMVLIPAAWLGRVPPEVLEAVLAHELAHLRRHDLWVNLLQRCVEAALFYHPAVWWLSRRVRVEREYCCDEAAATAVSGRAAYARALEFVATERVASLRPAAFETALAAGMGGDRMALLDRVRRVLGADGKPPRGNWLSEGLLALAVPAALWAGLATVGPAIAKADEAEDGRAENRPETDHRPEHDGELVPAQVEADEDVLILRSVAPAEGERDVLILNESDIAEVPDGERPELRPARVPLLSDVPVVARLFRSGGADGDGPADVLIDRREDVLIDRREAAEGADDIREALRELREEMKALRREVEEMRRPRETGFGTPHEPPRPPKPPGPPERMRRDSEADSRKGPIRFYLDKPGDNNGPARFEVRVFRDGDGGPSPDYLINRLHVEEAEGEPRVFLYREGKDGKPEKVEGRTEGDESVIELEDGRIHVRPLRGPEPANLKPRRPVPPLPPGNPAKAHRISRVVTLEIDGKQVPVVVEEHFNVEKGPAKDITVRVLPKAPPGADVWPVPKEKSSGDRGRAIRDPEREELPEEVREEVERAHREAERQAEKLREESEAVRERAEAIRREMEEAFRERERALEQTIHRLREQLDEARSAEEAAREDEPERRADEERREADEAAREAEDEAREAEDEAREEREEAEESKEQPEENETAAARPAAVGEAVGTESSNSGTYGDLFAILAGAFR